MWPGAASPTLSSQDPGIDLEIPWHNGLHDFSGYSDFSYACMPHELYLILDPLSFYPIPPLPTLQPVHCAVVTGWYNKNEN